jgi:hypothetical protein
MLPNQLSWWLGQVVDVVTCQVLDSRHHINKAFLTDGISKGNIRNKEVDCHHSFLDEIYDICLSRLI